MPGTEADEHKDWRTRRRLGYEQRDLAACALAQAPGPAAPGGGSSIETQGAVGAPFYLTSSPSSRRKVWAPGWRGLYINLMLDAADFAFFYLTRYCINQIPL